MYLPCRYKDFRMAIQSILFVSGAACGFKMAAPLSLGVAPVGTPSPATPPLLLPRHRLTSRVSSASPRLSLVDADDWQELESRLPSVGGEGATTPVLTLYRDTNGWCPFCERVWFQAKSHTTPFSPCAAPHFRHMLHPIFAMCCTPFSPVVTPHFPPPNLTRSFH